MPQGEPDTHFGYVHVDYTEKEIINCLNKVKAHEKIFFKTRLF